MPKHRYTCCFENSPLPLEVWAYSAQEAAVKFARDNHNNLSSSNTVEVGESYTGTVKRFNITREYEPMFSATEVRG